MSGCPDMNWRNQACRRSESTLRAGGLPSELRQFGGQLAIDGIAVLLRIEEIPIQPRYGSIDVPKSSMYYASTTHAIRCGPFWSSYVGTLARDSSKRRRDASPEKSPIRRSRRFDRPTADR